jgi:hypothetical protein
MTWPRRLWNILTLRCAAASELTSRELDERLDLPERLALRGHRLACPPCRRFRDQLAILREACRRDFQSPELADGPDALSTEARARIARVLRERGRS